MQDLSSPTQGLNLCPLQWKHGVLSTGPPGKSQTKLNFKTLIPNIKNKMRGFPGGAVVENLPANAGDTGSSPGLGRSHMPWSN